jgi:lipoprotein-releasing system ATP-binding protein
VSPALIEARGVTRVLPGPVPVTLVREVDFLAQPGELVAISGASGSGKSSLLYLLGLLDRPTEGTIRLDGRTTADLDDSALAALRLEAVGFVFQFHFLLPEFTVLDNVALPMRKRAALAEPARIERAQELLDDLGLAGEEAKTPDQLSGGQRQRVAIARALANDPKLILADEPTGSLDSKNGRLVFDIFKRLAETEGRAVITVTHDPALAALCHRQVHMADGRLVD